MDQEVAKTLAELELKLRELERELASVGRRAAEPPVYPAPQPAPVHQAPPPLPRQAPPPPPRQAPPPPPPPRHAPPPPASPSPPGRLVDEATEHRPGHRYSMETQETAFGEIPATKDEREAIEMDELVRFKEEMQHTLQGLIDEYSRLLSLRPKA